MTTLSNETLPLSDEIRIAHCVDLYESKEWSDYQHYCFVNELKQPFKQVFREVYVPTADELKEKTVSRRYAGHQVQPKKTVALLKGQAWTVDYDEGLQKVNHKQNIIARMFALADWFSPADVESPTLETIEFFDRKNALLKTLTLSDYVHHEGKHWRAARMEMVNAQTGKSTILEFSDYAFGTGLSSKDFSSNALKKLR